MLNNQLVHQFLGIVIKKGLIYLTTHHPNQTLITDISTLNSSKLLLPLQ